MPYRIDLASPPPNALELLIELGALDVDSINGSLAAILPDAVSGETLARVFGHDGVSVSPAIARDDASVWLLGQRPVRIGNALFAPPDIEAPVDALRLIDSNAFGTGHHPTTALCIEALQSMLDGGPPVDSILDVGTGSGILALAALSLGVPQAVGLDIDAEVLEVAAENAKLNHFSERLKLIHGGPDAVAGSWPLVVANVLAAPLIAMAPLLARRVASHGSLLLSGIPWSLEIEVRRAYEHLGMRHAGTTERAGWVMIHMTATW